jgi:tetratricopeptide (TPR) repeat protein
LVEGGRLWSSGDETGALAQFKAARSKHPNLSPPEVQMALLYSRTKNGGAKMIYWLERAVVESPNDPEAYLYLGNDLLRQKRPAESRLVLEKANQLLKDYKGGPEKKKNLDSSVARQLAFLAMQRKDWEAAAGYLAELLKLQPNDVPGLQMLGEVLFKQGRPGDALEKLQAAKGIDSKAVLTPEATMAVWYQREDDKAKAWEYMTAALKKNGEDYPTRLTAAKWALETESLATARQQAEAALQLAEQSKDIDTADALLAAGTVALFQNDYPAAEKYLRQAVAKVPDSFTGLMNLSSALCEQDDEAKQKLALRYAKLNYQLHPDRIDAAALYARALFRAGLVQQAGQIFGKIERTRQPLGKNAKFYFAALLAQGNDKMKEAARRLLKDVVGTKGLFLHQAKAEALLKQLGG